MLVLFSILLFFIAQTMAWIQINGQFVWPSLRDYKFVVSLLGIPISYILMVATDYAYEGMDQKIWPGRLMAFAVGILVFTLFTNIFLGEGLSPKVIVSLILSTALLLIQIL